MKRLCLLPLLLLCSLVSWAQAPVANFSASPLTGCAPRLVNFTDLSTNNPTQWFWDLGNGTTSTLQNPSTTYFNPGIYTITLTATNANGSDVEVKTNYIEIYPQPTVNFTAADSTPSCAPKTVNFTNLSVPNAPGTTSYLWDFGDGNSSTTANPSHTYTVPGTYSITLTVTNIAGCVQTFTKPAHIQAVQKPDANFSVNPSANCTVPATVTFTNLSTSATAYQWNFGDGNSSTSTSPTHTYAASGTYTVTLIAFNGAGCSDTFTLSNAVSVNQTNSSFTFNNNNQCAGTAITFTPSVSPAGGSYSWNFGDGNSSTAANPSHVYATGGTYTVTLTYTANGCPHTSTQTVTVAPSPIAAFAASNTVGCIVPHTASFTNLSSNATSYLWIFGDGNTSTATSPTHTYTAMGSYTVSLVAYSAGGCSDTITYTNLVNITPVSGSITATPLGGCAPLNVSFTASAGGYTIATYSWNLGNSTTSTAANPTTTYSSTGTYTVTLNFTTTTGCTGTATTTVTVSPTPVPAFNGPISACTNQSVSFTNNSSNATTYYWTFGDGGTSTIANPSHAYNNPGNYTVTLYAINGLCTASVTQSITISGPNANFTHTINCSNRLQVTFTNSSTPGNYLWDFGDATTSTAANPTKTYAGYGSYNVMLTVTDPVSNCQSFHNVTVNLFPLNPSVIANDTTLCLGQAVQLNSLNNNYISLFTFHFGDGSPAAATTSPVTNHTYTTSGIYDIKLVITDIYGCKDSSIRSQYIHVGGAIVDFTSNVQGGCSPLPVQFSSQITSSVFPIVGYSWQFGDGNSSTAQNPAHVYQLPGQYSVTLSVTDAQGCVSTITKNLYINASKPEANFSAVPMATCVNSIVQFTNSSIGSGLTYFWDFGDGSNSTNTNPTHAYSTIGSYTVTLYVTDINNCMDTITLPLPIVINQTTASFVSSDTVGNCPPFTASFTNTSINANVFQWDFGNGNTSSQPNGSTTYTSSGTFTVRLIASDSLSGCVDTSYQTIQVNGPLGTFTQTPSSGCVPLTINLAANATGTSQYIWDLDNGTTVTTSNSTLSYTYTQSGTYVPRVILSDANACTYAVIGDTIEVDVMVADMQVVNDSVCIGTSVQFNDTILQTESGVASINYQFGDGNSASISDPSHTYTLAGTYTVSLIITNQGGCADTITRQVTIHPQPSLTISGNTAVCNGVPVTISANGAATYSWSPSTGLSCTNCSSPVASPTSTTTYTVIGTSSFGCADTNSVTITVNPLPVISVAPPNDTICEGESTQFTASGANGFTWSPGTGLSCTNCPNPTASPLTTTTYTIIGNSLGCLDTVTAQVVVLPKPTVTLPAQSDICIGASTTLDAGNGASSFSWTPSIGLSCNNCQTPIANPSVTTTYTVIGGLGNGCQDTAQTQVVVHPLPTVDAGPDVEICEGAGANLNASGAQSYQWSPPQNLSCINCPNPTATPKNDITYTVQGTDQWGCKNSDQVRVTIMPHVPTMVGPGDTICRGEPATLTASGGVQYTWSPATGLSNTSSSTVIAQPQQTTTYTVVIKENDCYLDTHTVTVVVSPTPDITFNPDFINIDAGNNVVLQPIFKNLTNGATYFWSPQQDLSCYDCPNPVANAVDKITYTLVVGNEYGCSDTATITLNPTCSDMQLFMPNTFTPNGDQQNDWFYPLGKGVRLVRNFIIYNRWGELVFQRQNFQPNVEHLGWDGTYKNEILPPDVFVYYMEAECTAGQIINIKGDITIYR